MKIAIFGLMMQIPISIWLDLFVVLSIHLNEIDSFRENSQAISAIISISRLFRLWSAW
jgi:hypothetical protein